MRIAIIGSGMASVACAEALRDISVEIALFDKGARPGGRKSSRIAHRWRHAASGDRCL